MQQQPVDPKKTLTIARLMWFALLAGPVLFFGVVLFVIYQTNDPLQKADDDVVRILLITNLVMLIMTVPMGYFIRSQYYKSHWQNNAVAPPGYFAGNLLLWALCEGVCFLALITMLLQRSIGWSTVIALFVIVIHIINYPNGRAMQPADPDFGRFSPQ